MSRPVSVPGSASAPPTPPTTAATKAAAVRATAARGPRALRAAPGRAHRTGDGPAVDLTPRPADGPVPDGGLERAGVTLERPDAVPGRPDGALGRPEGTTSRDRPSLLPFVASGVRYEVGGAARLENVSLRIEAGAGCTVLMGANGAGKSLLLRLMNGLLEPDAGTLRWNGAAPDDRVRRRQSFVFQRPVLLRRSVRANLDFVLARVPGLGRRDRAARRDGLLALAGLADRARAPARRLSGGEQQRLALACALATDPAVLLLDEPTASLDPGSTAEIERIVAEVRARGTHVVLVTHDAGQARRLADAVVFLASGRVVEHAPAATFFDAPRSAEARDYLAGRLTVPARPLAPR